MVEQEKKSRSGQDQASGMPAGYEYDTLMNLMRVSVSTSICWMSILHWSGPMNFTMS